MTTAASRGRMEGAGGSLKGKRQKLPPRLEGTLLRPPSSSGLQKGQVGLRIVLYNFLASSSCGSLKIRTTERGLVVWGVNLGEVCYFSSLTVISSMLHFVGIAKSKDDNILSNYSLFRRD